MAEQPLRVSLPRVMFGTSTLGNLYQAVPHADKLTLSIVEPRSARSGQRTSTSARGVESQRPSTSLHVSDGKARGPTKGGLPNSTVTTKRGHSQTNAYLGRGAKQPPSPQVKQPPRTNLLLGEGCVAPTVTTGG